MDSGEIAMPRDTGPKMKTSYFDVPNSKLKGMTIGDTVTITITGKIKALRLGSKNTIAEQKKFGEPAEYPGEMTVEYKSAKIDGEASKFAKVVEEEDD